jgi:hypothetical protein
LESHRRQPIPGCRESAIYPLLRRPDAACSNACIIQTSESISGIDPDADPGQFRDYALRASSEPLIMAVPLKARQVRRRSVFQ